MTAVFGEDRKTISMIVTSPSNLGHIMWMFQWVPPEKEDLITRKDPIDAPPHNYTIQPENQGKLVWLSGPPGAGKSTIAALMSQMKNYVYYEADAFHLGVNPFVPNTQTGNEDAQHSLVGPGMRARKKIVVDGHKQWG